MRLMRRMDDTTIQTCENRFRDALRVMVTAEEPLTFEEMADLFDEDDFLGSEMRKTLLEAAVADR
ncbi:MAG: hypothetical protein U9N14_02240 [Pseudomonadota bacterium]|nr:hypothetical protein [Pseudomonadota bacterium]